MTQICIQIDRKPGRQQVSSGQRGYRRAPGSTPCSQFHRLFLCGWVEGCRLMKGVWTTKKSGSHLADTPAHLWPSESSHHDRPPPPPTPAFSALSLPTSAHLPLGQTTSSGCPVTAKHGSPTVASNGDEEKRKSGGARGFSNEGILFEMKISSLCKRRVLLF